MLVGVRGGGGDSGGGGKGLWKEVGRPGCASRQFSESTHFRVDLGGPLWGGVSLQSVGWRGLGSWDPQKVRWSFQSVGGTYCCGPSWFKRVCSWF
jgi:hypothetical protein